MPMPYSRSLPVSKDKKMPMPHGRSLSVSKDKKMPMPLETDRLLH